ncbi:MAG: gamma carbonic anhydrase family protein [Gordonia sp.]|nr:gamma carbonic anhydrase family protein [Gordonia sp. (in: high G+C Gram-positive bacteria)]
MRYRLDDECPEVANSAWVADSAILLGQVTIEAHVSVFYGSILRADLNSIVVRAGTNIQDGCVLHSDPGYPLTVGTGVTVGHRAILHGCTIGDDVLVGMGAVIMNGSVIGPGSIVAAHALIPENTMIPPNSLVAGVPGRVRRGVTEDETQLIQKSCADYQALARRHAGARRA